MLQNREVAGARMGAGRRPPSPVTFGPYGYLSFAAPVALIALISLGIALDWPDPVGLHWSWLTLVFVAVATIVSRLAAARGAAADARWRSGPHTLPYWTQRVAPWAVLVVLGGAAAAHLVGAGAVAAALVGVACGMTVGVGPVFLGKGPAQESRPTKQSE